MSTFLGAEVFFFQLAAFEQILAAGGQELAAERGVALAVLVLFSRVKTGFLGLQNAAGLLNAAAETTKQSFKALSLFAFDFNHNNTPSFLLKNSETGSHKHSTRAGNEGQ
ncbi:MAG: hypothetical protein QY323_02975 [Patescibacteria group bacterium]|nr:MAG: hypothetical protein QY323_02975 [Patescibacteria group bacterium]